MSIPSRTLPAKGCVLESPSEDVEVKDQSRYVASKVAIDKVMALLILAVSWPLILALMALVRLTSRGPAIYRQVRLGLDGREYEIFKLRTMYHECERLSGPKWSTASDTRVTAVGRYLRRYHLDELPQLWNVLRGEMSMVGPRPERPEFVCKLAATIPGYRDRLRVRPGITGLAQVQLPPDEDIAGVHDKVAYDRYYVRGISPWLDFRILVATAMKILEVPFDVIRLMLGFPTLEDVREIAPSNELVEEHAHPQLMGVTR